jgi:hypothetical protein
VRKDFQERIRVIGDTLISQASLRRSWQAYPLKGRGMSPDQQEFGIRAISNQMGSSDG